MDKLKKKRKNRWKRHKHIRHKLVGTAERPRLCVFRSAKHIYCQIINDMLGKVLCGASTLTPVVREEILKAQKEPKKDEKSFTKTDAAALVGAHIAKLAKEKGIEKISFDRGGFKFHGRIKALAEATRKEGIQF